MPAGAAQDYRNIGLARQPSSVPNSLKNNSRKKVARSADGTFSTIRVAARASERILLPPAEPGVRLRIIIVIFPSHALLVTLPRPTG